MLPAPPNFLLLLLYSKHIFKTVLPLTLHLIWLNFWNNSRQTFGVLFLVIMQFTYSSIIHDPPLTLYRNFFSCSSWEKYCIRGYYNTKPWNIHRERGQDYQRCSKHCLQLLRMSNAKSPNRRDKLNLIVAHKQTFC